MPIPAAHPRAQALKGSDGLCVTTRFRATSAHCEGAGCRPPLPLSSSTHSHRPVGAGHARPAALPLPPRILCIVGRGLDPSAGRRERRPLQHNPQGFSLPQTSAAAWGQAALHPTLPHSVGRAFARNSFTLPCHCHPFILCIVGRGLDPSATFRRRSPPRGVGDAAPYSGKPHGFSLL